MRRIPERWEKYLPVGCRVPGTRFLPFKVPLKPELCRSQPESEWFTPTMVLENNPMLKAVIDLTNTDRYYNYKEFTNKGVLYKKINVFGGGKVPSKEITERFFEAVDQLTQTLEHESDALIGVHCTHGLNRTGYLICKYMVLRLKIDPQEAINSFQEARGHQIERNNYVSDIKCEPNNHRNEHQSSSLDRVSVANWRDEEECLMPSRTWRYNDRRREERLIQRRNHRYRCAEEEGRLTPSRNRGHNDRRRQHQPYHKKNFDKS